MKILSPAKINLFLQIDHKRSDGYHDLASLMCCVSLYDEITLKCGTKRTQIKCCGSRIPQDESNLAHQAAVLFLSQLKKN